MERENKGLNIGVKSFITAIVLIFILMVATYLLTILIPGASADLTIPTLVPVAETVIVGEVPDTYADFAAPGRSEP